VTRPWCEWQLIGSAETVRRKLQAYLDVGFNHVILHFATPGTPVDVRQEWATRFAREVAPDVSPALGAAPAVSGRAR
jgi:alkanesulfonate monooxygenase SsuD/methylene tetrahydromethanopterin reductase-like flavin-dependent oxidoreductase (luciferase family)